MDILLFIAIALICGYIGGKISNRFRSPAVVGYLIVGLLLGPSVFKVFDLKTLDKLGIISDVTLSVVAFIIGSEMLLSTLRRIGKGIAIIILSESFLAYFLVLIGVYLLTHKLYLALIFGAMAPASAPAGTVAVVQEYRAKGPLTDALFAVVGLDDGLAIMIYAFSSALAKMLITGKSISVAEAIGKPLLEITIAIALGAGIGFLMGLLMQKIRTTEELLTTTFAGIFLCTGLSKLLHCSLILSNLSLGMVFANLYLRTNRRAYRAIEPLSYPLYIVFFLIAGAHLQIKLLPAMGAIGVIYIILRSLGLIAGASLGATIARAPSVMRKYLGFGILSQAGVAVGLAMLVTREFAQLGDAGAHLATTTINIIAATTIFFEIIGPIGVKFALSKAGEIGKR